MSEIAIKLIDHVGETQCGEHVDFNQWIVFADDVQIGYLQKTKNAWLQCIVSMDDEAKGRIIDAVNRRVANGIAGVVMPPEPIEEDEDE
jgi:hypothetical protein